MKKIKMKRIGVALAAVVAGSLIYVTTNAAIAASQTPREHPAIPTPTSHVQTMSDARAAALQCKSGAVPSLFKHGDTRLKEFLRNNPTSSKVTSRDTLLDKGSAISLARSIGNSAGDKSAAAPAAAALVNYSRASQLLGSTLDPHLTTVAPDRCVWIVTVKDGFTPHRGPQGIDKSKFQYKDFTVIIDQASGEVIDLAAPGLPDSDLK